MKRNKKGFTIIELVIVIAVIGVLTAVLVPVFINLANKANEASDQSLVKTLNTVLTVAEADVEKGYKKPGNPTEMFEILDAEGYKGETLLKNQKSDKTILYKLSTNRFEFDDGSQNGVDYWEFTKNNPVAGERKHSFFLYEEFTTNTTVNVTTGLDVGQNDDVTDISYSNSGAKQNVVIRTNGGSLTIDAKNDTVRHYEKAALVDIKAIAGESYHEYGEVSLAKVSTGRIVVTEEAALSEIRAVATDDAFNEIKIALVGETELPLITRDAISLDASTEEGTHSQLVLELQNLSKEEEKPVSSNTEYVWASVTVDALGNITSASTEVATSKEELTPETIVDRPDVSNSVVTITKVKNLGELISALNAKAAYIMFTDDIVTDGSSLINAAYNVTIDGGGYSLTGDGGLRGTTKNMIAFGHEATERINKVTIKNINIQTQTVNRPLDCRGNVDEVVLENVNMTATGSGNDQGFTYGGNENTLLKLTVKNCNLAVGSDGYAFILFNPVDMNVIDSTITGWGGLYFKAPSSSHGSRDSKVLVQNSSLVCHNENWGATNAFGAIVFEDGNIDVTLVDSSVDVTENSDQQQDAIVYSSAWAAYYGVLMRNNSVIIKGASAINGKINCLLNSYDFSNTVSIEEGTFTVNPAPYLAPDTIVTVSSSMYKVESVKTGSQLLSSGLFTFDPTSRLASGKSTGKLFDDLWIVGTNVEISEGYLIGGTFDRDVRKYLKQGYLQEENGLVREAVDSDYVAFVDSVGYFTVADAMTNWASGTTLKLNTNISGYIALSKGGSYTLDLNGHSIHNFAGSGNSDTVNVYNSTNLTITDTSTGTKGTILAPVGAAIWTGSGSSDASVVTVNGGITLSGVNAVNNSGANASVVINDAVTVGSLEGNVTDNR